MRLAPGCCDPWAAFCVHYFVVLSKLYPELHAVHTPLLSNVEHPGGSHKQYPGLGDVYPGIHPVHGPSTDPDEHPKGN